MRFTHMLIIFALMVGTANAQTTVCQDNMTKLATAQSAQLKANVDAVSLFLTFGVAAKQGAEKRKSYFSAICQPDQLASFDKSMTTLEAAIEAAKEVENTCPEGHDHDNAIALQKQYETIQTGTTKMLSTALQMCRIALQ